MAVYDPLSRSLSVVSPSNSLVTFGYDADSRRTLISMASSIRAMGYDPVGQLTTILQYQGPTPVQTFFDTYNGAGWKTAHSVNGVVTNYTNDAKGRLLGQAGSGITATFAYDGVDNMLLKWHQGQSAMTMTYDQASRLQQMAQGSSLSSYAFDNSGNQIQEELIGTGLTTSVFDFENRLLQISRPGASGPAIYSYAGDTGLRRTRQEGGQPIHTLVWDGSDYLGEY